MPRLSANRTGHRWTGRGWSADDRRKTAKAIRETRGLKPARKGGGRKIPKLEAGCPSLAAAPPSSDRFGQILRDLELNNGFGGHIDQSARRRVAGLPSITLS